MNSKRIEHVDLFRAFGIILMIMGHIKFGNIFDKWIHAFHMPMFFFISGWFFQSKGDVADRIKKKMRSLIVPYVVFEIVQWIVLFFFIPEYRTYKSLLYIFTDNTYKIPIKNGTFGISPIPGAMWFLTAIFFAEAFYITLDNALKCNWKLHISIAFLVATGMVALKILPFRLPWALDASFIGIGFFHIARVIKNFHAECFLRLTLWQSLLIGIIFSAIIMLCPRINMRTGTYGWYLPFWINALGAIMAGWNISRYAEQILIHSKFLHMVLVWLKGIGKNSIVYLCMNQTVIMVLTIILNRAGIGGMIRKVFTLLCTMIILLFFEKLICETKLKQIIGRR